MSKRSKNSPRRADIFFLDRNLGSEKLAGILRPAQFTVVAHNERYGAHRQFVDDPEIIADCGKANHILITADGDLEYTYAAEIYSAKIAILLLMNNSDGPDKWGPRILSAIADINTELSRRKKPFLMRLSTDSYITQIRLYRKKGNRVVKLQKPRQTRLAIYA